MMTQKVEMNLKNLKENDNYIKNFLRFVQRVARECDLQDAQDWIYQDTEMEDGEPCLWAGRYDSHRGKIEVHEYAGVNEESNDFGNNIPTTVISIDCCQGGVGTSGREWEWRPGSRVLAMGENGAGNPEMMELLKGMDFDAWTAEGLPTDQDCEEDFAELIAALTE